VASLLRAALPAAGLGLGVLLVAATEPADAYTVIGGSLAHTQRDFRVHDNFTSAAANDNATPDPMFPGATGAVLAIWKASVEWGSSAHGDGSGDPSQPELGSGGANFDPSFQGLASGVGGTNDNIHSEISGSSGGVLAYAETPISDGWRIRYYQAWDWSDGPGVILSGQMDLQSIACHEYGHALGLGHSLSGSATMAASTSQGLTNARSLHSDDRAGVQAIYGVAEAAKPTITAAQVTAGVLTITGANFDPTGNQVWFTRAGGGGNGDPIKVTGLPSNGTQLVVSLPSMVGPGDLLVRRNGTHHGALSNAWPSDLQEGAPACGPPAVYCSSTPNSSGQAATIGWAGTPGLLASDLTLLASGCPPLRTGLFYCGPSALSQPFGNGVRCVGGPLLRFAPLQTDAQGSAVQALDLATVALGVSPTGLQPGSLLHFQFWFRDPAGGGAGFDLSDGLAVTLCP